MGSMWTTPYYSIKKLASYYKFLFPPLFHVPSLDCELIEETMDLENNDYCEVDSGNFSSINRSLLNETGFVACKINTSFLRL